jgi:hypothetical protein
MPEGWMAIGPEDTRREADGRTCVLFPRAQSVTFVDTAHFVSRTIHVEGVHFPIHLVWRNIMTPEQEQYFTEVVERGFRLVSTLYPYGVPNHQLAPHTVMMTAGVIGEDEGAPTRFVYPNVGENASYAYRWPSQRMEELLLHAVAHLYNRFRFMYSYRPSMATLPFGEYQEYVASWVESRYIKSDSDRWRRALFLQRVHEGVSDPNIPLGREVGMFRRLGNERTPISANIYRHRSPAKELKKEYAHYVLAPLLLIALDGLLAESGKDVTVEEILRDVHTARYGVTYYGVIGLHLSAEQIIRYRRWEEGMETIPRTYIELGLRRYDTGFEPVDYATIWEQMPTYIE